MILCVEDDSGIRNMMVYTLSSSGFEAKGLSCGRELFDSLNDDIPDLILLDIMLPGEDGLTILKKLRASPSTERVPIIMATAKGSEYDRVIGLDCGADDYLSKPFGMMEMVSRVKAVLRRTGMNKKASSIERNDIVIDIEKHSVSVSGSPLQLTLKEFDLLKLFLENPDRVFSREQLLSIVWGIDFAGETRTVDVHIATLREKLGDCKDVIETVRGVGYRMTSEKKN